MKTVPTGALSTGVTLNTCTGLPNNMLGSGELCDLACASGYLPRAGTSARYSCSSNFVFTAATLKCDPGMCPRFS